MHYYCYLAPSPVTTPAAAAATAAVVASNAATGASVIIPVAAAPRITHRGRRRGASGPAAVWARPRERAAAVERCRPAPWTPPAAPQRAAALTRYSHGSGMALRLVPGLTLLLALSATALADVDDEPSTAGPTLLRKCCGAHEQLNAQLDACVAWGGAAGEASAPGDARLRWEGAGAVRRRAGDRLPWWLNAATPLYDAQTGAATDRPLLRAQPPNATLRYGPRPPCARSELKFFTWNSRKRYRLLSSGTLLLRTDDLPSSATPNLPLPPDLYCADRVDMEGDMHVFITCPCNKTLCVNKCCPLKQELIISAFRKHNSYNCVSSTSESWKPQFLSSNDSNDAVNVQHILLAPLVPTCSADEDMVLLNASPGAAPSEQRALRVLANGSAVLEGFGFGRAFAARSWCGDWWRADNATPTPNALACLRKSARPLEAGVVYGSLFLVGAFFLVLTLLVYALLPEMRRSAHAKALLCHVGALLAGSLALAWGQLRTIRTKEECYFIGFFIEYWMLATFFWLTAVCVEIARTFSEMLPANLRGASEQSTFLWYSLYAWGGPAIITTVAVSLEFAEGLPDHIVRPDLGKTSCFLGSLEAQFAYFYGPVTVLLAANLALFVYTTVQLVRARRDTALVDEAGGGHSGGGSTLADTRERTILHLKLFVLMGLTWVLECASLNQKLSYWYVTDAVNMLRGVFIFVIFCCKRDVLRRLRKRLRDRPCCARAGAGVGDAGPGGERGRRGTAFTLVASSTLRRSSCETLSSSSSDARARAAAVSLRKTAG